MKTTIFQTSEEALESLMLIINKIEATLSCGIFACEAMGSLVIEFASSTNKGDEDKEKAKEMVGKWMNENNIGLEHKADAFRSPIHTDWAIESNWWTTEEFE
jgi:UDP-N-acetylglucosamine pyrophosphorylase